jgi:hypothetical protein
MSFVLMHAERQDRAMPNAPLIPLDEATVVIRVATSADRDDLGRLAALDSARPLGGTVLVAQSDAEIRAAYAVEDGRAIGDPFRPTAGLVELLKARAALLHAGRPTAVRAGRRPRLAEARS